MKKTFLTPLILLCVVAGSYAQFNQGRVLLSGKSGLDLSILTSKTKTDNTTTTTDKSTSFSLSPMAGYFVIDNLAIGASLNLSVESSKDENTDTEFKSNGLSFGPFVRYYFEPGFFAEGQVSFGSGKTETIRTNATTENKYGIFGFSLGAGYAAFISDNIAIEPSLSYVSNSLKPEGSDTKFITSGIVLSVGISAYLGK